MRACCQSPHGLNQWLFRRIRWCIRGLRDPLWGSKVRWGLLTRQIRLWTLRFKLCLLYLQWILLWVGCLWNQDLRVWWLLEWRVWSMEQLQGRRLVWRGLVFARSLAYLALYWLQQSKNYLSRGTPRPTMGSDTIACRADCHEGRHSSCTLSLVPLFCLCHFSFCSGSCFVYLFMFFWVTLVTLAGTWKFVLVLVGGVCVTWLWGTGAIKPVGCWVECEIVFLHH